MLDFGLAKASKRRTDDDSHFGADEHAPTARWSARSPTCRRSRSRKAADPRSDVFARRGAVRDGDRPPRVTGNTLPETLSAILTARARSHRPGRRPASRPNCSASSRKCLEKDRTRRYQTLCDIATDLEKPQQRSRGQTTRRVTAGWRRLCVWLRSLGRPRRLGAWDRHARGARRPQAACDRWRSCRSSPWPVT